MANGKVTLAELRSEARRVGADDAWQFVRTVKRERGVSTQDAMAYMMTYWRDFRDGALKEG